MTEGDRAAETDEVENILERRRTWFRLFWCWQMLQWTLAVAIAGGSAFVASRLLTGDWQAWVAVSVAVCAAIQNAVQPESRANAYREAWVTLDLAVKAHSSTPDTLVEGLRRGEERIGQRSVRPRSRPV